MANGSHIDTHALTSPEKLSLLSGSPCNEWGSVTRDCFGGWAPDQVDGGGVGNWVVSDSNDVIVNFNSQERLGTSNIASSTYLQLGSQLLNNVLNGSLLYLFASDCTAQQQNPSFVSFNVHVAGWSNDDSDALTNPILLPPSNDDNSGTFCEFSLPNCVANPTGLCCPQQLLLGAPEPRSPSHVSARESAFPAPIRGGADYQKQRKRPHGGHVCLAVGESAPVTENSWFF